MKFEFFEHADRFDSEKGYISKRPLNCPTIFISSQPISMTQCNWFLYDDSKWGKKRMWVSWDVSECTTTKVLRPSVRRQIMNEIIKSNLRHGVMYGILITEGEWDI